VRRRWLTRRASLVAVAVGLAVVFGTGAGGGLLLLVFLSSSSALTRLRASAKVADGGEHAASSGGRTGGQVWANGGVAALCAMLSPLPGMQGLAAGVAGALAAATADSWATEIGTAVRGKTVLVTSLREVTPGTSGGMSIAGTLAGLSGSILAGCLVTVASDLWATPWLPAAGSAGTGPWPGSAPALAACAAITLGGVTGMLVDSVLGATLEGRRPWIDNEAVNLLATLVGAAVAVLTI
jgi:uncharacterized membrane protein